MPRLAGIALVCLVSCGRSLPEEADVTPEVVAEFASFGEGLVFVSDRAGYLSDLKAGVIHRFSLDGEVVEWARSAQPNGHRVLADGTHLVADAAESAILRFDGTGSRLAPIAEGDEGPLVAPNDISLDDAGGFYFTDPRDSGMDAPRGRVHYVDRAGAVTTVARDLAWPNGIAVHPDGRHLYVGESMSGRILRYPIVAPGRVGPVAIFAHITEHLKPTATDQQVLDGMTFDLDGHLYVAYHRVGRIYVLDPAGAIVRRYDAGQRSVSNVAFGGPGLHQLYAIGAVEGEGSRGVLTRLDLGRTRGWSESARWADTVGTGPGTSP